MKITCVILTYNEASRIRIALTHALKWADEVLVVDKGSTDDTREIADQMGAKVAVMNFSLQGHEDNAQMAAFASNDWVWGFTPGEVPTRAVIEAGRELVSDVVDLIYVPMRYYSFGVHSIDSPWAGGYQPRLYNQRRVKFTGVAHSPIQAERIAQIQNPDQCYVLHQTHATAKDFMRSHADYMQNEAKNGTPDEVIARAEQAISAWVHRLNSQPALFPQARAWRLYWLGVALHAWERKSPGIPEEYRQRAAQALSEHWGG